MTDLIAAVKKKDKARVGELLAGGADPNENALGGQQPKDADAPELNGPLHWACRYNLPEIVDLLLDNGASLFVEGESGQTPVHLAHSSPEVANLLIEKGANVFVEDGLQRTPLYVAVQQGDTETVKALLEAGSDANSSSKSNNGRSALHEAGDSVEKCKLLIQHGADVNATDDNGKSVLHYARHIDVVRLLTDNGCKADVKDKEGCEPIHDILCSTTISDKGPLIKLLLERGATKDAVNAAGETPLYMAVNLCNGFTAPAAALLEQGASPNVKTKDGSSPLLCAMTKGYTALAQLLIKHGASLDEKDKHGNTVCHYAAQGGNVNLMLQLFKSQKPEALEAANDDGDTPLHFAVVSGHINMVAYLISVGADVNVVNKAKQTALDIAKSTGKDSIARTLEKHIDKTAKPPPPPVVMATEDCQSGMPGHLPFVEGQLIAIVSKPYEEWWEGYTLDDPDMKGLFCILLVDQQPLDEDAARAAIDASGKAPQNIPADQYSAALTELTGSISGCVDGQAIGLFSEQEEQLRNDNPDLAGDERRLLAVMKAALASEEAAQLEKAPLLRAINKAIDRLDSQVSSASAAAAPSAGDSEASAAASADAATGGQEPGQVTIVVEPFSEEEMDTIRTASESLKEQLLEFKEMVNTCVQQFVFSVRLAQKLSEVLLAFRSLALGLDERKVDASDKACSCVQLLGEPIPLPGACLDEEIRGRPTKAQVARRERLHDQIRRIASLAPTFTTLDDICLGLAQALVSRYDAQINQLMYEGAVQLAEGVVLLLLEYLLVDCPHNQDLDTIVPSLVNAVVFTRRSALTAKKLKTEGIPCQSTKVVGKGYSVWSADGILRKTGILTAEGRKYVGLQTRADLFGYRHGTKAEVEALNMVRQGYEKTIGPNMKRRTSKGGMPQPPAAPVLDTDPTTKATSPTQREVAPVQKSSYWLRKQEELSERIKQLELLANKTS